MMDILMSETSWAHKKWNKIASDIRLVLYSSTITMMHVPISIRFWHLFRSIDFEPKPVHRLTCRRFFMFCWPCIFIITFVNNQLDAQFFFSLYLFIPIPYMYRAATCSSSGESILSIQPLVYVTLCRWPSDIYHTVTYLSDIYRRSYRYNWLSWWRTSSCSKHVRIWNKQI